MNTERIEGKDYCDCSVTISRSNWNDNIKAWKSKCNKQFPKTTSDYGVLIKTLNEYTHITLNEAVWEQMQALKLCEGIALGVKPSTLSRRK